MSLWKSKKPEPAPKPLAKYKIKASAEGGFELRELKYDYVAMVGLIPDYKLMAGRRFDTDQEAREWLSDYLGRVKKNVSLDANGNPLERA